MANDEDAFLGKTLQYLQDIFLLYGPYSFNHAVYILYTFLFLFAGSASWFLTVSTVEDWGGLLVSLL